MLGLSFCCCLGVGAGKTRFGGGGEKSRLVDDEQTRGPSEKRQAEGEKKHEGLKRKDASRLEEQGSCRGFTIRVGG